MDASAISKIIADDLVANPDFFNAHNVDLQSCLVSPEKMQFESSFREGEHLELWLVLRERPEQQDGYLVVFDDREGLFGLAIYGKNDPVFIGYYGSFTETLSNM